AVVGQIDGKAMCTSPQLKELVAAGWEIGSKGMTGVDLTANPDSAGYEISTSRTELGKILGVEVKTYSYPGGVISDIINGVRVSGWGYLSAAGLGKRTDITTNDIYYLPRYEIFRDTTVDAFAGILPVKPSVLPTQVTVTKQVQ
ncbi:MAG: polysaccharide deacetylase family protein, partial [Anaerolineae bacterium]|nr:polysaccharide deacetylase family protein [Anaerolineae bacterium]